MSVNLVFSALADPTRRAILRRLASGEATVGELVAPLGISQPAVSRHLRILEQAGLISRRVEGATRPCRVRREGLDQLDAWLEMMRDQMEAKYDRLDEVLMEMEGDAR